MIRPATQDDLKAILKIENQVFPLPWTKTAFEEELNKPFSHVLVLESEPSFGVENENLGELVGYLVYWTLFEEAHLLSIAIDPSHQCKGLGSEMVRYLIKEAQNRGLKKIILEVRTSNRNAIQLYQNLGFFIDHKKTSFYEDGEDAFFMVQFLDPVIDSAG